MLTTKNPGMMTHSLPFTFEGKTQFKKYTFSRYNIPFFQRSMFGLSFFTVFLGIFLLLTAELSAQATFRFNQKTKAINTAGSKWKVDEYLTVIIDKYESTNFTYQITYRGEEQFNEAGLADFRRAAGDTSGAKLAEQDSSYIYLVIPIVNKDYSLITIEEFNDKQSIDKQTYYFRNYGGLKFDVSTGFFISWLKDDSYIIKGDPSTMMGVITKEQSGNIRVGIGVLAHLHSRCKKAFNWGGSVGFELDNDATVGYLAGISGFFGYDQKIVVTVGGVLGKKEKISNAYYEGQQVDFSLTVVPTVDVWAGNIFLGVTYNF